MNTEKNDKNIDNDEMRKLLELRVCRMQVHLDELGKDSEFESFKNCLQCQLESLESRLRFLQ